MKCCGFLITVTATALLAGCGSGNPSFSTSPPPPPNQHNEWTWVGGANVASQPGSYGTQGTPSANNIPGGRGQALSWTDSSGNFWLFGGISDPTQTANIFLNDFWKYSAGEWTWVGGSSNPNQAGTYGTEEIAAAGNVPGARNGGTSWVDKSGNLWLFGGLGLDSTGTSLYLNDLWEYSSGQWTWMSGSSTGGQPGIYGTQGAASSTNVPGARQPAASWLDASGDFWIFGGVGFDSNGSVDYLNDLWKYSGGQWTWMSGSNVVDQPGSYGTQGTASSTNVPGSRLESLAWADTSGNLWLFGGSPGPDGQFNLFNDLWKYSNGQWTWMDGSNSENQIGNYGLQGTAAASNVPGARVSSATWTDASGNFWLFGGNGYDSTGRVGQLNDLWKFSNSQWTWVGGSNGIGGAGLYGTMGTAGTSNIPGARTWAAPWIDSSGNLWLFGGNGFDSSGTFGYLNDLWEYEP
jgi:N-acetylneuraminic acid mutarotase